MGTPARAFAMNCQTGRRRERIGATRSMRLRTWAIVATAVVVLVWVGAAGLAEGRSLCYDTEACVDTFRGYVPSCAGPYCGRIYDVGNGTVSDDECVGCPAGFKTDGWVCLQCADTDDRAYAWFYISFVLALTLVGHVAAVIIADPEFEFGTMMVASIVCTVVEIVLAAVVTVLVLHPGGEFRIAFCSVDRLADFYTALHNPPDAYCATEAAYPLYSAPLLFYGVSAILVLLVRLPVTALVHDEDHEIAFLPIYIALYYFPVAALVWLIFGGLIYYSFPVIILLGCVMVDPVVFNSLEEAMEDWPLHVGGFVARYLLMTYAVFAILSRAATWYGAYLAIGFLAPLVPTALYFVTLKFTKPEDWLPRASQVM